MQDRIKLALAGPFGKTATSEERMRLFYWLSGIFILLNAVFIYNEVFLFMAAPLAILIFALAFLRTEIVFFLIVLFTPLSVNIQDIGMGYGISLPAEPLIMLLLLVFSLRIFLSGSYDRKFLVHPVSIAVILHLVWMGITAITSEMPLVSFKFLLARVWFVMVFYFFAMHVFSKKENREKFLWFYIIPLLIVIFYTIYRHYTFGFDEKAAHWVMDPFYNDHTAYAAVIAMFIPFLVYFCIRKETTFIYRFAGFFVFALMLIALGLSYTRAAWLSITAAFGVYILAALKIRFRTIAFAGAILAGLFLSFQQEIFQKLERNRQDSSKDISRHLQSISNIRTDASNLERINRWHSAWRMFLSRPITGYGPGTYQFQYAPFQLSSEHTIISTNAGTKGTAHSEYLGPLAEQGVPGSLFFILILITSITCSIRFWSNTKIQRNERLLSLTLLLGLITYFTHALMNNFLDTDKASVPFWGFIAIIVSMDALQKEKNQVLKS